MERPVNDADAVVLAGGLTRPREAVGSALRFERPVLHVPGRHEFHGGGLDAAAGELQRLCAGTHLHRLDTAEVVIDGVRFLGTCPRSEFVRFDDPQRCAAARHEAARRVRDAGRPMDSQCVAPWIHGHTHDSFDCRVDGTREVCKPRGDVRGGVAENANCDPDGVVEVDTNPPRAQPSRGHAVGGEAVRHRIEARAPSAVRGSPARCRWGTGVDAVPLPVAAAPRCCPGPPCVAGALSARDEARRDPGPWCGRPRPPLRAAGSARPASAR